jgi:hypothetical protein
MIREKRAFEISQEIHDRLRKKNYPVKVDFSEPIEGADIGIKVMIQGRRNWKLERQISHEIHDVLEKYDLIPSIDWEWINL